MANLAVEPVRGRRHRHHGGAGEGAAAVRRAPHHQGQEGRRAPAAPGDRDDPRPGRHAQAVRRDRARATRDRNGGYLRILKLGPAPRRQRAHGAHRTGVTQLSLGETLLEPSARAASAVAAGSSSPTTAPTSAGSPRSPTSARSRACCATRSGGCCGSTTVDCRARGAPTPACTRGARWCRSRSTATPTSTRARRPRGERASSGPRSSCATASVGRRRLRRPPLGPLACYRYTIVNRPAPDPFLARTAWWVPEPLDLRLLRLGGRPVPRRARLRHVLPQGPRGFDHACAGCSSRAGTTSATACSATTSRATAFCWQMVRSIVGTLVDVGVGQAPRRRPPAACCARATATRREG